MKRKMQHAAARPLRFRREHSYARGTETRTRLIEAGIEMFGRRGFEGASTRDIALAAGLNAPALQYYFDNKDGLYRACARAVAARAWTRFDAVVTAAEKMLEGSASDSVLVQAFCGIQSVLADLLGGEQGRWFSWMACVERGAARRGLAPLARLTARITRPMSAIVARLLGRSDRDAESVMRQMSLNGQLFHFFPMHRRAIAGLRARNLDVMDDIKRITREHSVAALVALARGRGGRGGRGGRRKRALRV
jgi:AcrR family transcriptional regulator